MRQLIPINDHYLQKIRQLIPINLLVELLQVLLLRKLVLLAMLKLWIKLPQELLRLHCMLPLLLHHLGLET